MKYTIEKISPKEKTIKILKDGCWHEIVEVGDYGGSRCKLCSYRVALMWYCPDSPDHVCHYFTMSDKLSQLYYVESINGERIFLDKSYKKDGRRESEDSCIFCGDPEERK